MVRRRGRGHRSCTPVFEGGYAGVTERAARTFTCKL
jgi:hypothetical protein